MDSVMGRIEKLFQNAYEDEDKRILDLFAVGTGGFIDLTAEARKMLENRFTYCVINGAVRDNYEGTKEFLKSSLEKFHADYDAIRAGAFKWLESFLCDNKKAFVFCPLYLSITKVIASDLELFFRKFTNTRKHGATMHDQEGKLILHDFCDYSPSLSLEYVPSIFLIQEYGESFEEIYQLYQDVIIVIRNIYYFTSTICQLEKMRKENPEECMKSLQKLNKEILENSYRPTKQFPSPWQVDDAKSSLPEDVVEKIFTLPIPKLCTELYHELPSECGLALVVLFAVRQQRQMDLTDEEYLQVFPHINDPMEKHAKACQARYLLAHIEELAKNGKKTGKPYIDKGKVAWAFYEWTGTNMGEISFVGYYNQGIANEQFKVAQSTINHAHNHAKISEEDNKVFYSNLEDLLRKYELETTSAIVVSTTTMDIHNPKIETTASFQENDCMRAAES